MTADATRLAQEVERLYGSLARRRGQIDGEEGPALTPMQRLALGAAVDDGPQRPGVIAGRIGTTGPTATRTVDALAAMGLVERIADTTDRRAILVRATPRGRKHIHASRKRLTETLSVSIDSLPEHDRERLVGVLAQLNDLLRA